MKVEAIPFWMRVVVLVLLMAIMATVEVIRYGRQAKRWQEYIFVLTVGAIAGIVGMANDIFTSWLSPHYFILGKGLPADGLRWNAAVLGLDAGFTAGVIAGAVCLYVNTRNANVPRLSFRQIATMIWRPLMLAVAGAVLMPLLFSRGDPLGFTPQLAGLLINSQIAKFLLVWWIHLGLYFGLITGVIWMLLGIAQARKV